MTKLKPKNSSLRFRILRSRKPERFSRYRKGVFLIVFYCSKKLLYLALKRKLHWKGWECVKGGVEKNESILKAVKRELKEETSLKPVRIIDMKEKSSFLYPKGFRGWPGFKGMKYQLFAVQVKNKKIKLDKIEHSGYKWLEYNRAYRLLTFKEQKSTLKLVNERFNK